MPAWLGGSSKSQPRPLLQGMDFTFIVLGCLDPSHQVHLVKGRGTKGEGFGDLNKRRRVWWLEQKSL